MTFQEILALCVFSFAIISNAIGFFCPQMRDDYIYNKTAKDVKFNK